MAQPHFIRLMNTIDDMIRSLQDDSDNFKSLATVANQLLELGEIGKKFNSERADAEPGTSRKVCTSERHPSSTLSN